MYKGDRVPRLAGLQVGRVGQGTTDESRTEENRVEKIRSE
jgi:hypothetical protein